jgi:hypothetical protein
MPEEVIRSNTVLQDSGTESYRQRLLVGTAATGLVRIEWALARWGQTIPCNWSLVQMMQYMDSYVPLRYQVADAQNLIVKQAVEGKYEWLLMIEHDTCPPPDAFLRFNAYMRDKAIPVVSGLYYSRSRPSEPLVYRGRGNSFYGDWKLGDLIWCDGVPAGMLLIHCSLLQAMWDESPEYAAQGQITRRVFETPSAAWFDPETNQYMTQSGTSDLTWCDRVMKGDYLRKAGWGKFAEEHPQYPFLIDTNIFAKHIDQTGEVYP